MNWSLEVYRLLAEEHMREARRAAARDRLVRQAAARRDAGAAPPQRSAGRVLRVALPGRVLVLAVSLERR